MDRLTVPEAATLLGVTQAAIYKRISRGKIPHDKDAGGHVYVYLDTSDIHVDESADKSYDRPGDVSSAELVAELKAHNHTLRDEVEAWREEARRKDHIIAGLVQRVPELEPVRESSPEPREASQTVPEEPYSTHAPPEAYGPPEPPQERKRSWWREFFGLE
jgi:excisionase family DNA binding protein